MRSLRRALAAVLTLTALSACVESPGPPAPESVQVAPGLTLVLPRPTDLGRSLDVSQFVTVEYADQTFTFEGQISATPERFLLAIVDPVGRRALTITWTDQSIRYDAAPWYPQAVRPENILADLILLYWPEEIVRAALHGSGGSLLVGVHDRSILLAGREVIHADFQPRRTDPWSGTAHYQNRAWHYDMRIQSVVATR